MSISQCAEFASWISHILSLSLLLLSRVCSWFDICVGIFPLPLGYVGVFFLGFTLVFCEGPLSWGSPCVLWRSSLLRKPLCFVKVLSLEEALVFYGVLSLEEVLVFVKKSSLLSYLLCLYLGPLSWGDSCVDLVKDLPCEESLVILVVYTFLEYLIEPYLV